MRIAADAAVTRQPRQAKNVSIPVVKISGSMGDKPAGNRQDFG
jgi:hypothetical protein